MKQWKNNYCVCAVLQEIFVRHKIKISQDEIAKNLTLGKEGFRIDDNRIKNFLKEKGFDYEFYWWNKTPFNEPDMVLKDIHNNNGFLAIGDHVRMVLEFEDPMITVMESVTEVIEDFSYSSLMKTLKIYDGGFGLIKKL